MKSLAIALPLALAYLRERALATWLNIALLALGIATLVALLVTVADAERRLERDAAGIDAVVGAKGSPLQLVLSAVFQVDIPTGNIPAAEAARIARLPAVKHAVPVALGDSYRGYRIVGTDVQYLALYGATFAAGTPWQAPMQAVLGAEAARATGLTLGTRFASSHGLSEGGGSHAQPFEVVGVLAPTGSVVDRLVLTSVDSVRDLHDAAGGPEEITALLVQYASPVAAMSFPRDINANTNLQAASPAVEAARLFALAGIGITALKAFAGAMLLAAALGIFIGLSSALDDRRADLALLRVLGADRATVSLVVLAQGFALGTAGVILGLVAGHAGAMGIGSRIAAAHHGGLAGLTWVSNEAWLVVAALALSLLAACLPAWRAYREAVPELLGRT